MDRQNKVRSTYIEQISLLLSVLPSISAEEAFALKGGTAINLFYRDMPRLSVDIDLTYLPVHDRETSLKEIDSALDRIIKTLAWRNPELVSEGMYLEKGHILASWFGINGSE